MKYSGTQKSKFNGWIEISEVGIGSKGRESKGRVGRYIADSCEAQHCEKTQFARHGKDGNQMLTLQLLASSAIGMPISLPSA